MEFNSDSNSALAFCKTLGLDVKPVQGVNTSMSVEKMILVEKIQRFNYQDLQDILKPHLYPLIRSSEFAFSSKPKLQDWVKPIIYNNHREDLKWLKENYGIDFLQSQLKAATPPSLPEFTNNRVSVRDVYKVDEQSAERYEALVMDILLKNLVKNGNRSPAPRLR